MAFGFDAFRYWQLPNSFLFLAIFEGGGIDVVWLSTILWVSLSMMLKNALFFSNLEDQH